MTKAFTLIEVLIAVSIMFGVGFGLLQVSSNSLKIISHANVKNSANSHFSLPLLSGYCEDSNVNLYDSVKDKFSINDDDVVAALREMNFTCENNELLNMDLADNTELNKTLDEIPNISFTINKINAAINGANVLSYEVKALM